jgi:hypothetical protein
VYEDNVLLQPDNIKQDDWHFVFTPGIELTVGGDSSAQSILRYQHTFTRYDNMTDLDDNYPNLSFQTRYDSGIILLNFNAGYREEFSNNYGIDEALDYYGILVVRAISNAGGNVRYEMSELTAIGVGVDYTKVNYDLPYYVDYNMFSVPVTFYYKIRPTIDLTAGYRYRSTDTSAGLRYKDQYVFVGAVGELFSPVLYADVSVGYQKRDVAHSLLPNADSASYNFRLTYTGLAKATVYAAVNRDYRTSAQYGSTYAFMSGAVGGSYALSKFISLNGSLALGNSKYEQSSREEDITILRVGASYRPNDYVTFSASYYYRDVDGNVVNYTDNEFRVTASLRY